VKPKMGFEGNSIYSRRKNALDFGIFLTIFDNPTQRKTPKQFIHSTYLMCHRFREISFLVEVVILTVGKEVSFLLFLVMVLRMLVDKELKLIKSHAHGKVHTKPIKA
jgi:hypothetical protein